MDELFELLEEFCTATLIHCNYFTPHHWQRLNPDTTIVYCPRTHAYFGHSPHPYLQMMKDGVRIALGTDSLASNPDLSILNECRFLWGRDRHLLDGPTLLNLATNHGVTTLQPNMPANFVVIPHDGVAGDPWELLWSGTATPRGVYLNGQPVECP